MELNIDKEIKCITLSPENSSECCLSTITFDETSLNFLESSGLGLIWSSEQMSSICEPIKNTNDNMNGILHGYQESNDVLCTPPFLVSRNKHVNIPLNQYSRDSINGYISPKEEDKAQLKYQDEVEDYCRIPQSSTFDTSSIPESVIKEQDTSPSNERLRFSNGSLYSRIMRDFSLEHHSKRKYSLKEGGTNKMPQELSEKVCCKPLAINERNRSLDDLPDTTDASNDKSSMYDDASHIQSDYTTADSELFSVKSIKASLLETEGIDTTHSSSLQTSLIENNQFEQCIDQWREVIDENTGKIYFYNRRTRESRWCLPDNAVLVPKKRHREKKKDSTLSLEYESRIDSLPQEAQPCTEIKHDPLTHNDESLQTVNYDSSSKYFEKYDEGLVISKVSGLALLKLKPCSQVKYKDQGFVIRKESDPALLKSKSCSKIKDTAPIPPRNTSESTSTEAKYIETSYSRSKDPIGEEIKDSTDSLARCHHIQTRIKYNNRNHFFPDNDEEIFPKTPCWDEESPHRIRTDSDSTKSRKKFKNTSQNNCETPFSAFCIYCGSKFFSPELLIDHLSNNCQTLEMGVKRNKQSFKAINHASMEALETSLIMNAFSSKQDGNKNLKHKRSNLRQLDSIERDCGIMYELQSTRSSTLNRIHAINSNEENHNIESMISTENVVFTPTDEVYNDIEDAVSVERGVFKAGKFTTDHIDMKFVTSPVVSSCPFCSHSFKRGSQLSSHLLKCNERRKSSKKRTMQVNSSTSTTDKKNKCSAKKKPGRTQM